MGARKSKPDPEKEREVIRKRISNNLQQSREKHLSAILTGSVTTLVDAEQNLNVEPKRSEAPDQQDLKESATLDNGIKPATGFPGGSDDDGAKGVEAPSQTHSEGTISDSDSEVNETVTPEHASLLEDSQKKKKRRRKIRGGVKGVPIRRGRLSFHPVGRYHRSSSFHDDVDRMAAKTNPEDYTFFFENLVFEGGGNKGLAYCGAVRYLEELGVMSKVKRFSGASAGGIVAGLLAVGYTSGEIEQFLSDRIDRIFLDASCGYFSLLPNILRSFGWNPGQRIYDWFGDKLKEKTGDADVTFQQLYQKMGRSLCIIVTNLSQMTTEYCHPKTTPDMSVRLALRMSMAIPGLFSAMRYSRLGQEDVYVDGGVLCNYPVHCFDGWYLSMDPKDSFLRRFQPLRDIPIIMERHNRFGEYNERTLGMLLYSDAEEDILRINLERRVGCLEPAKPERETKLYQQRMKEARQRQRAEREYAQVVQAVDSFLRVLKKHDMDGNDLINRQELEAAFKDEEDFPRHQAEVLFGKDFTVNEAFQLLDRDNNGQVRYDELLRFIEENGVSLQSRFLGYQRREINNFVSFLNTLKAALIYNIQKLYVEERDLERTVGINTGHVHTTDFVLEPPDRDFVVQRGYNSMKAFLKYYVVCKPDNVLHKSRDKSLFPDIPETGAATFSCPPVSQQTSPVGEGTTTGVVAPGAASSADAQFSSRSVARGGSAAPAASSDKFLRTDEVHLVEAGEGRTSANLDEVDVARKESGQRTGGTGQVADAPRRLKAAPVS